MFYKGFSLLHQIKPIKSALSLSLSLLPCTVVAVCCYYCGTAFLSNSTTWRWGEMPLPCWPYGRLIMHWQSILMRVHKLTDTFFWAHTARTYGQNAHGHTQIDGHINIQVHGSIAAHIQKKKHTKMKVAWRNYWPTQTFMDRIHFFAYTHETENHSSISTG